MRDNRPVARAAGFFCYVYFMKKVFFLFSYLAVISCHEKSADFNFRPVSSPIVSAFSKITCDTATINGKVFKACQSGDVNMFLLNESSDTIYKHPDWTNGTEFIDFNEDGYKDILFHYLTNVPEIYDLALYNPTENKFKMIANFQDYPAPYKIKGTDFYYSYHRSGCADSNWDSDLFYIENYKCYRIGNIHGVGCEGEEETGIFIYEIFQEAEVLIESIPRKPGYHADKWEFIDKYWTKNYSNFQ